MIDLMIRSIPLDDDEKNFKKKKGQKKNKKVAHTRKARAHEQGDGQRGTCLLSLQKRKKENYK